MAANTIPIATVALGGDRMGFGMGKDHGTPHRTRVGAGTKWVERTIRSANYAMLWHRRRKATVMSVIHERLQMVCTFV